MKVVLDTNCLLSSHDLTLYFFKNTPSAPDFWALPSFFVIFFVTLRVKMRGLMKKVALFLNIFHFQYPIVIFHPAPDGGAGKVCHVVDLRIGQADAHEVADLLLLFRITA